MIPSADDTTAAVGRAGERRALRYLYSQGYDILERNFRCRLGEIDLIAYHGPTLVFIEVKTRAANDIEPALQALDREQQERIHRAAEYYRRIRKLEALPHRFDLVAVEVSSDGKAFLQLRPGAF